MPQFARPISDVTVGGWFPEPVTPTTLWDKVDEDPAVDTDNIHRIGNGTCELALSSLTDPAVSTGHIIKVRARTLVGSGGAEKLTFAWVHADGSGTIASRQVNLSRTSTQLWTYELTAAEADSIVAGDYADPRCALTTSQGASEESRVTWVEFEVPDAAVFENLDGVVAGVSTSAGLLDRLRGILGAIAGVGSVVADFVRGRNVDAASSGTATVSGTAVRERDVVGSSDATAVVAGVTVRDRNIGASSLGAGMVSGELTVDAPGGGGPAHRVRPLWLAWHRRR